jgi:hypothetical protein
MMPETRTTSVQSAARRRLGTFMTTAGTGHLTFAGGPFQAQVPDVPSDKDTVVLLPGGGARAALDCP